MGPQAQTTQQSPPSKRRILEGVGLLLIIIGFFVCSLFLFHSTYAFIGPVLLFIGVVLIGTGRFVNHRYYKAVRRVEDIEGVEGVDKESNDNEGVKGQDSIKIGTTAIYTNSGYVGSQPGKFICLFCKYICSIKLIFFLSYRIFIHFKFFPIELHNKELSNVI